MDPGWRDESENLYDGVYSRGDVRTAHLERALGRMIDAIDLPAADARFLDVGFGGGDLLDIARARGFATYGTEVSKVALDHASARGHVVTRDASNDPEFRPASFQVVTLIETLEHVVDGPALLAFAHSRLASGGVLYLTTPNADSLNRRMLGVQWDGVGPPDHRTLWTTRGLSDVLARTGFTDLRLKTEGLSPVDLLQRLRRLRSPQAPAPHHATASAQVAEAFEASRLRRFVKASVNACLRATRLGDTLKARATRP